MNGFFAWFLGLLSIIPGVGQPAAPSWNGYIELDYVYAAAPGVGTIASIPVKEGQLVKQGDVLFALETTQQQAQSAAASARADAAEAQVNAAQATLANLRTGARPEELLVTQASLNQAEANLALAQQNFARAQDLFAKGNTPKSQLDQAQASLDAAQATVAQLKAQLVVNQLPARTDQIDAAAANVAAAEASLAAARADAQTASTALADRTVTAPEDGRVERLFFKQGEVAGAGVPVVSLAGADAIKVKFYLSEADRTQFALGDKVSIACDGCASGMVATISYFASDPQFTPPIIYSRDERKRLVFLTEATMGNENGILPGQPVTIGRVP
jgi:HlyD family secretion protein